MRSACFFAAASVLGAFGLHASSAGPPPATSGPVDALAAAPDNFILLLENDQVRVLRYTLAPGARDNWHTHPPRVGFVLSGASIRVTQADGSHRDFEEVTGDTYWSAYSPLHDTLNVGTAPYAALLIEVKGPPPTSASADSTSIQIALAIASATTGKERLSVWSSERSLR